MIMNVQTTRKLPLQSIPYLDMSQSDLFAYLLSLKNSNCPTWTDESTSDFGIQLLHLYSVLHRWIVDNLENVKNNTFLPTATSRNQVRKILTLLGYQMSEALPSSVTVTFTCETGHPMFTIYQGTQVSTADTEGQSPQIFEVAADTVVNAGVLGIDVLCTHGQTVSNEVLGSSDGTTSQIFKLSKNGVIWQSETIQVFNGVAWESFTRVIDFTESSATDKHYKIYVDDNENYTITFGDGTYGAIPQRGVNNVRVSYRTGGGLEGNVAASSINRLVVPITYVTSVVNAGAASGGSNRESIERAKVFAPASIRALDRCVTVSDIETLAQTYVSTIYGQVANAKANVIGGLSFSVMVVPRSGRYPLAGHRSELQSYLAERLVIATSVEVVDPIYKLLDINAEVFVYPNYSPDEVANRIRERLVSYISPAYQDPATGIYPHGFGRNIYASDIYGIIDGTEGVNHCTVTLPGNAFIVGSNEIVDIGSISLTMQTPTAQVSYYSSREDIDKGFRDRVVDVERGYSRGRSVQ